MRCSWNISELELAEVVVFGQRAFTLINLYQHCWLVVHSGREDLRFARGDDGVAKDMCLSLTRRIIVSVPWAVEQGSLQVNKCTDIDAVEAMVTTAFEEFT
jgi:hypothetical protein